MQAPELGCGYAARRQTFRGTSQHLEPQKGHSSLLMNQRLALAVQTTWFEHGLVRDRGRAVVQRAVLSYGLSTFRKISSTAALTEGCSAAFRPG
jgi:hypothetical protein